MNIFWQQCEGESVDGFTLERYLGGGEDHAVFLTHRPSDPSVPAAIKILAADAETTEDQLRRWRLASELTHPNLLRLFERGHSRINDIPVLYVVMEYASENLSEVIPDRPLTPDETRAILAPALSALTYLHAGGLVHGRLKLSNFFAVGEELKLSSDSISQIGPDVLTAADDVWALGYALVEALTQRRPDQNANPDGDPALPSDLPSEFHDIVRHALRRDPERRWTIAQIQERSSGKSPNMRRQLIAVAAGVAIILLAMIAGTRFMHNREQQPSVESHQSVAVAPPAAPTQVEPAAPTQVEPAPQPAPQKIPPPSQPEPVTPTPSPTKPQATASSSEGGIVNEVTPDVMASALRTIHGKVAVEVRLNVDSSGDVREASFALRGPSQYFANAALAAARRWKFTPDGAGEWLVRFQFTRAGTKISPTRVKQ